MNNIIFFIQEYTSTSCRIITCVLSLLFLPFPVLKASSLEFVHLWRVWKTRNVVQSQKALARHAVTMETEVHARNSSFMIAPSSTVITNLSRKATNAITGLMLFTINRANAIQTLLDMTAASASLATMAKTRYRKKPWIAKFPQVVSRGEGSINEVHQHVQVLHKQLCGDFDTIWRDQQNRHGQPRRNNASLLLWLEREKKNNAWYIYLTSSQPPPNLHNLTSAWPVMLLANKRLPYGSQILARIMSLLKSILGKRKFLSTSMFRWRFLKTFFNVLFLWWNIASWSCRTFI